MAIKSYRASVRQSIDVGLHQYMMAIYRYMALGLGLTGLLALALAWMPPAAQQLVGMFSWISMFATFGIVLYFNYAAQRIRVTTAQGLFWLFSALMGVMMTSIFRIYNAESIAKVFLVTAGTFGATSAYGHFTQRDLTSVGSFCRMGLWGLIIASVVNIFVGSAPLDFALSIVSVIVFVGLSAYDTQKLKQIYYELPQDGAIREKSAILGALTLYLDVINLFLSLLHLMGDRK